MQTGFGAKLRELRQEKGMTLRSLAEAAAFEADFVFSEAVSYHVVPEERAFYYGALKRLAHVPGSVLFFSASLAETEREFCGTNPPYPSWAHGAPHRLRARDAHHPRRIFNSRWSEDDRASKHCDWSLLCLADTLWPADYRLQVRRPPLRPSIFLAVSRDRAHVAPSVWSIGHSRDRRERWTA